MVKFEATGSEEEVRTFLESMADVSRMESVVEPALGRLRVVVPVKSLLGDLNAKIGNKKVTLTFTVNTGNIQIQTAAQLEDKMLAIAQQMEKASTNWHRGGGPKTFVGLTSPAVEHMRHSVQYTKLASDCPMAPTTREYAEALEKVAETVKEAMQAYPLDRDRLLKCLHDQYGWGVPVASMGMMNGVPVDLTGNGRVSVTGVRPSSSPDYTNEGDWQMDGTSRSSA